MNWEKAGYTIKKITDEEFNAYRAGINTGVQLAPFQGRTYYCLGCHGQLRTAQVDKDAGLRGVPCAHHELYNGGGKVRASYPVFPAKDSILDWEYSDDNCVHDWMHIGKSPTGEKLYQCNRCLSQLKQVA